VGDILVLYLHLRHYIHLFILRDTHSENLCVDGSIILKYILGKIRFAGVECIYLIQDRKRWRELANTIKTSRFPRKAR
jgi:hypothetical protein